MLESHLSEAPGTDPKIRDHQMVAASCLEVALVSFLRIGDLARKNLLINMVWMPMVLGMLLTITHQ